MAEGLTDRGRPIFGPTPPGQGPPCARQSPLTGAEVAEVAALIAGARRGRQAAELPERLRTRDWDSVVAVLLAVDEALGGRGAGVENRGAQRRGPAGRTVAEPVARRHLRAHHLPQRRAAARRAVHQLPVLRVRVSLPGWPVTSRCA